MRLLESTDIVPIHNDNRYNTYNYEVSDIMSYVTSRGYNAFILDPNYSNGGYWIRMFNIVADNGAIYLLDYLPSSDFNRTGYYGESAGYSRPICALSSTLLGDVSISVAWTYEAYQDRMYYTFQEFVSDMHGLEYAFYTTAEYSRIFVNNEDVTPVTYNWISVPSVSGKNGILSLSTSTDTNNGEAITTSDTTKFALTAESNINKLIVDRMNQGD